MSPSPLIRGDRSPCPGCGGELLVCKGPKLGPYRRHIGRKDCRFAPKPMTPWHRRWQELCDRSGWLTEQIVEDDAGMWHIADAVTAVGQVIEFQHSAIKPDEVQQRNTAHDPLVWIVDGAAAATAGAISYADGAVRWSGVPSWLLTLANGSDWVVADFDDCTVRLSRPTPAAAGCTFAAVVLTAHRAGESGDEYRSRFLDVIDLCADRWDRAEFLEWSLSTDGEVTAYLAGKGTTPSHAVVWVRGCGSVDDLVEVHRRADAVSWILPANVFETHHGSWLAALARREGVFQSVDRWFEKSYARHLVDDAGIAAGPAAEWCNRGRDPASLIWVQRQLTALGTGIDVVWKQHKGGADNAWQELKAADTSASHQNLDAAARSRLMAAWVAKWAPVAP